MSKPQPPIDDNQTTVLERKPAHALPPPPLIPTIAGISTREWFTGMALLNVEMMHGLSPDEQARLAVRVADETIAALAQPRVPVVHVPVVRDDMNESSYERRCAAQDKFDKHLTQTRSTVPACPKQARSEGSSTATVLPPAISTTKNASSVPLLQSCPIIAALLDDQENKIET